MYYPDIKIYIFTPSNNYETNAKENIVENRCVTVIILGNGDGDLGSNTRLGSLCFIWR